MESRFILGLALLMVGLSLAHPSGAGDWPVRGITLSTHTNGGDWGTDAILPSLEQMKALGANWVAIHPYARISPYGSVRFWSFEADRPPEHIVRPIREAHARGLKILIKPHLAYWGSGFSWRGDIDFHEQAAWERFWESYTRWIVELAGACRDADAFVVGTELDRTIGHEEHWRGLIREVRNVTSSHLTYAANWTHYEQVGFWDELDAIGIQAYFPLADSTTVDENEIVHGWEAVMREVGEFAARMDRYVVFTELGYSRSFRAPVEPWAYRSDGPEAEEVQTLCMRAALEAIERESSVVGAFLWKWFPEPHPVGRNFQLATPSVRGVIADVWLRQP